MAPKSGLIEGCGVILTLAAGSCIVLSLPVPALVLGATALGLGISMGRTPPKAKPKRDYIKELTQVTLDHGRRLAVVEERLAKLGASETQ